MEKGLVFEKDTYETTPMMRQYFEVKKNHPNELLFFRMGDFFELFFEDAKIASSVLNIALTTRNKHNGSDVPMCGVPVTSVEYYLSKLIKDGFKVVVCDQLETPEEAKKRGGYKAVVKRDVVKIVTPGTITDEPLLGAKNNNFLMSILPKLNSKKSNITDVSFAVLDISTDEFYVHTVSADDFLSTLCMFSPKEILISDTFCETSWFKQIKLNTDASITILSDSKFNYINEKRRLERYFGVSTLDSLGIVNQNEISVCGSIVEYIQITQCGNVPHISFPKKIKFSEFMIIDASTIRNLEIVYPNSPAGKSLLQVLDDTVTAFGGRMFASRIVSPLTNIETINARLDSIDFFIGNAELANRAREILSKCPDIERALVRMKFGKVSARDLCCLREGLRTWQEISKILDSYKHIRFNDKISLSCLFDFSEILKKLNNSLEEEIPITNNTGKIIKCGFSKQLDEVRSISSDRHNLIASLQHKYSVSSGASNLKIKNNNILGWYIEIPLSQKNKMSSEFIHRQTLVNGVRYVTDELIDLQLKLNQSETELAKLEEEIVVSLINDVISISDSIHKLIEFFAILDIAISCAKLSKERSYVRPSLVDEPKLEIVNGRHPVLDLVVDDYVSNNCILSADARLSLLTGPNMAGKSTYLRQNALIILMAQIGVFVPAKSAIIGITDRLFSRIGALDDLAKGRSTFMVEMIETATILNQATDKSFIILDEVGRGTSTYDGLSIAWAVVEHLNNYNKSRVIFATHYMELTNIMIEIPKLKCQTLKVQEWAGDVIFHHSIIDGVADKSYGIYVAKLAGLPRNVICRAKDLQKKFENHSACNYSNKQLSIFDMQNNQKDKNPSIDIYKQMIDEIEPDGMTPKEALEFLYKLKKQTDKKRSMP